jgi:hypothetical protein
MFPFKFVNFFVNFSYFMFLSFAIFVTFGDKIIEFYILENSLLLLLFVIDSFFMFSLLPSYVFMF